jgi:hypothetical protein
MNKFIAALQLLLSALLAVATVATVVNVVLITANQENSISVVNVMIGQGVLIIFLAALSRILFRKGLRAWHAADQAGQTGTGDDSPAS